MRSTHRCPSTVATFSVTSSPVSAGKAVFANAKKSGVSLDDAKTSQSRSGAVGTKLSRRWDLSYRFVSHPSAPDVQSKL